MAKNAYAKKLFQAKENAYGDGVWDGFSLGLDVVAIALNRVYGFGNDRLTRLEAKVQELVDEIIDTNDSMVTREHIKAAVNQIRKKGNGNDTL